MGQAALEVDIFQIVDDAVLKGNRTDGSGWDWCWADWQRDWMSATPNRNAYRCLPLTIANQTGWWIKNPVGFQATWTGGEAPESIDIAFDVAGDFWKGWINNQFGSGIITWNTPFLFRTRPEGSRLLVCGPANYFKRNAHALTAFIESDWMTMSFTMNWKLMAPGEPVRFEMGDPLFQAIPLKGNVCADLETARVHYQKLDDDPELNRAYYEWNVSRKQFHEMKARGEVKPDEWQKDYFQGRGPSARETPPQHMTKVKPPRVQFSALAGSSRNGTDGTSHSPTRNPVMDPSRSRRAEPQSDRPDRPAAAELASESGPTAPQPAVDPEGEASVSGVASPEQAAPAPDAPRRRVDDEWRRWIAENLMSGAPADDVLAAMAGAGIARDEAAREIDKASQSPYFRGAEVLRNRLKKRDWLLATYRKINRMHPVSTEIPRRHRLPRQEFLEDYYSTNRPVIITGMMDDWPALRKWNLDFFAETFGDREVEVQNNRNAGDNYEMEREKYMTRMPFGEFVEKVRSSGITNDFYLTANNNPNSKAALGALWDDVVQFPEYLDGRDRLSGFFWMGPAGTVTPFHHDLTNNLMAQVIGRKRVKIAPSWDIPLMENHWHVFSRVDGRKTPPRPYARPDEPQLLECILYPGELLFLPIGSMHYVEGIDITVTVSFTNFLFDNDFRSFYTTYQRV